MEVLGGATLIAGCAMVSPSGCSEWPVQISQVNKGICHSVVRSLSAIRRQGRLGDCHRRVAGTISVCKRIFFHFPNVVSRPRGVALLSSKTFPAAPIMTRKDDEAGPINYHPHL